MFLALQKIYRKNNYPFNLLLIACLAREKVCQRKHQSAPALHDSIRILPLIRFSSSDIPHNILSKSIAACASTASRICLAHCVNLIPKHVHTNGLYGVYRIHPSNNNNNNYEQDFCCCDSMKIRFCLPNVFLMTFGPFLFVPRAMFVCICVPTCVLATIYQHTALILDCNRIKWQPFKWLYHILLTFYRRAHTHRESRARRTHTSHDAKWVRNHGITFNDIIFVIHFEFWSMRFLRSRFSAALSFVRSHMTRFKVHMCDFFADLTTSMGIVAKNGSVSRFWVLGGEWIASKGHIFCIAQAETNIYLL